MGRRKPFDDDYELISNIISGSTVPAFLITVGTWCQISVNIIFLTSHSTLSFSFDGLFNKFSEDSYLIFFVVLKIETVVLSLSQLIMVVIKSFFGKTHFISSCLESVESLAVVVNFLVELPPVVYIFCSLSNCSFFNFFFRLSVLCCSRTSLLILCCNAAVSDFDCRIKEKLILKSD